MIYAQDITLGSYKLSSGDEISFSYQKRSGMQVGTAPIIARITAGKECGPWFIVGFKSFHKIRRLFEDSKTSNGYIIPEEIMLDIIDFNFK